MAESQGLFLLDEGDFFQMSLDCSFEFMLCSGSDDDADLLDPCVVSFIQKEREHGLGFARCADKGLERKVLLVGAGGRDDGFGDLHKLPERCLIFPKETSLEASGSGVT